MDPNNIFSNASPSINHEKGKKKRGRSKNAKKVSNISEENEEAKEKNDKKDHKLESKEKTKNEKSDDEISVNGSIDIGKTSSKKISLYRTVSIKRANSLKNKPLFPEEIASSTISKTLNEEKILTIKLDHEKYEFDMKNPIIEKHFSEKKNLKEILDGFDDLKLPYHKKQNEKINEISKITDHSYYTTLDCFFEHLNLLIQAKIKNNDLEDKIQTLAETELDRCCICQCDLYESIFSLDLKAILKSLELKEDEEVIKLDKCAGHYFHKSCFLSYLKDKTYIKCPVCSLIYGVMIGDQPDGKMTYSINKFTKCQGYQDCDTIIIEYNIRGTEKDGIKYHPTHRIAYLPNNPEGREVLNLLKTAFERRLIFTLGFSVTTGRANQIVWNGIHHKTNLSGGPSYFGYPDETYFNRIKQELAAKGIY